jgi:hypothetical protein
MWGSPEHQIGIVDYPGAQVACIMGLTDLFAIASGFALGERQLGDAARHALEAGRQLRRQPFMRL